MAINKKLVTAIGALAAVALAAAVGWWVGGLTTRPAEVAEESDPTPSGYAPLLDQEIRGMSAETIAGYRTGQGMGMALPAELNGYPGPRHALDMADELGLTEDQREEIQTLFDEMQAEAIPLGEEILAEEAALEQAFRDGTIDQAALRERLERIAELEGRLRYTHLRTHLATIAILDEEQIMHYNVVRGYADHADMEGQHDMQH